MSVLGERIKKLRGGENEMAFGEVVNFIPVRKDMVGNSDEKSYFAVEVSGRSKEPKITDGATVPGELNCGFFLKTQKSPAFNRASLSYLSLVFSEFLLGWWS